MVSLYMGRMKCEELAKYVLIILNTLCMICGILLTAFGIYVLIQSKNFELLMCELELKSVPIVIIVLGCIIFLITFLGLFSALKEDAWCRMSYVLIVIGLFIAQVILILFIWIYRGTFIDGTERAIETIWDQHVTTQPVMNLVQKTFDCCGSKGPKDYNATILPRSCCDSGPYCDIVNARTTGCKAAVRKYLYNNIEIIQFVGMGLATVELLSYIFGVILIAAL